MSMDLKEAVTILNRHHHRMEPNAKIKWYAGDCGCRPYAFPLAFLEHKNERDDHQDFTLTPFEAIAIATAYESGLKRSAVDSMRRVHAE